ncbi:MAG: hypothetical protein ACYDA4_17255 [Ignavibacteriaceae bacterium]
MIFLSHSQPPLQLLVSIVPLGEFSMGASPLVPLSIEIKEPPRY